MAIGTSAPAAPSPRRAGTSAPVAQRLMPNVAQSFCAKGTVRHCPHSSQSVDGSLPARVALPPRTETVARDRSRLALMPRRTRSAQPRATLPAAGTALLPRVTQPRNTFWAFAIRVIAESHFAGTEIVPASCSATAVLQRETRKQRGMSGSKRGGPPNSPSQPTHGRFLARRFRASFLRDAARRAATHGKAVRG